MKITSDPQETKDIITRALAAAERYASKIALTDTGSRFTKSQSLTFGELYRTSGQGAGYLRSAGIGRGHKVIVLVPPGLSFYLAVYALLRAGGVAVFLTPAVLLKYRRFIRKAVNIRGVITLPFFYPFLRLCGIKRSSCRLIPVGRLIKARAQQVVPLIAKSPAEPAMLTFTTGTTGLPKPVVRSYGYLAALTRAMDEVLKPHDQAIEYCTFLQFVFNNTLSGMQTIIGHSAAPLNLPGFVKLVRRSGLSRITASPGFLVGLAVFCHRKAITLPSLQQIFTGGAPVHPAKLRLLGTIAPQSRITFFYGSSEALPISSVILAGEDDEQQAATADGRGVFTGYPVSRLKVKILAVDSGKPAGPGQVGEIIVTGDNVNKGSRENLQHNKIELENVIWHRTGDAGFLDEKGGIWLVGRLKHSKKTPSGHVFPYQVEMQVENIAGIQRCGCVFAPQENRAYLFLEKQPDGWLSCMEKREIPGRVSSILEKYGLRSAGITFCRKIPVDHRHYYRVNYQQLLKRISSRDQLRP